MPSLTLFKSVLYVVTFLLLLGTSNTGFTRESTRPASIFFVGGKILFRAESTVPTFELVGAFRANISKPIFLIRIDSAKTGSFSRTPTVSVKPLKNIELLERSATKEG